MKPGQRLPLNAPCHCGSGRKYKNCCLSKDREASKRHRFLYLFLMTHGTGDPGRTTNPRVLESWAEIERQLALLDIKFDKAYVDSDCEREDFPREGLTIPTVRNINLDDFDPQYEVLLSLARRNPKLKWVPCESYDLMEEFRIIAADMLRRERDGGLEEENLARYTDIIYRRDLHIAKRIREDLNIGEVGVLFLGSSHNQGDPNLEDTLSEDEIGVTVINTSSSL
jgi:hypothetical protein